MPLSSEAQPVLNDGVAQRRSAPTLKSGFKTGGWSIVLHLNGILGENAGYVPIVGPIKSPPRIDRILVEDSEADYLLGMQR